MASIYVFTVLNAMMCVGIAVGYVSLARLADRIHADLEAFGDKIDGLDDEPDVSRIPHEGKVS